MGKFLGYGARTSHPHLKPLEQLDEVDRPPANAERQLDFQKETNSNTRSQLHK